MKTTGMGPRLRAVWERVRNEPGLKRNVSVLTALLVLGVVVGGVILSNARAHWPWDDEFRFVATFDQAPAVSPGNGQEVRIAGVNVGEIREAEVSDDGKALLTLGVDRKHTIYDNASMVLRPKSPLNEMYIELNPGGPPGKPLDENATLPASAAHPPVQVDEVFAHLDENTQTALTTLLAESDRALVSAPGQLPQGLSATDSVLNNLRPVVEQLRTRKDSLARLITALSTVSQAVGGNDQRLRDLASSLQQTLRTTGQGSGDLDAMLAQLPDVATRLKAATDSVQGLSAQLDPTLENLLHASGTLPDTVQKVTGTVDRLQGTVDAAKPVVAKAGPVVRDLRPLVGDVHAALPDLKSVTGRLDQITAVSLPHLVDLQAFVYNTRSAYSLKDANGGILRGMQQYSPESVTGLLGLLQRDPHLLTGGQSATPPPATSPGAVPVPLR